MYLENKSIFIIREVYAEFKNVAMLWSAGKDSTTLLWLIRKSFFGKIPFPIIHIDTGFKFEEIYEFRDKLVKKWNLNLLVTKNEKTLKEEMSPDKGKFICCTELKTNALKTVIEKYGFKALFLAIRRDEHSIRSKERTFSPRNIDFLWDYKNQPPEIWNYYESQIKEGHIRAHPLLDWQEIDVWEYIKREKIPTISLYFAKGGKRYRSIGCRCCCVPVDSDADTMDKIINELKITKVSERSGRAQDKESQYTMQKLRSLGYM